ncbi:DUF4304 domain-containing protein [Mucilaginibacter sp. SMC90]|uniref:DUF4304 domain-containing protein n=1 Tax=Mucilaginibacter sp. SMC90 TaxID=2929803 RepID=UPI001FB35461|nr:DUF4304 domain-containing protein [Mucilaginibacter sp. SMC90]UOE50628.1 DUF4304 domain-containing protein [Mucilaginibacter sp. SMC90]
MTFIISKLFRRKTSTETVLEQELISPPSTNMTAKEKQLAFIKDSLKPLLKAEGYKTIGNIWWKINGPFFNLVELQNFSWNSRNSIDFCFNFTTGFTSDIKNSTKPTIHDGIPYVRESYFEVSKNEYWKGTNGYQIDDSTDLDKFTKQVLKDFDVLIIPKLNLLTNEDSIISFYSDEFWGPRVKQSLTLRHKNIRIDN